MHVEIFEIAKKVLEEQYNYYVVGGTFYDRIHCNNKLHCTLHTILKY
jgi:hypothetical protein